MHKNPTRTADLMTALGTTMGVANVIMQLTPPEVGYGVLESRVDSGSTFEHPFKRARTTGQYLAVAVQGNDDDAAYVRDALRTVHDQVTSTPDSPVRYSANNPRLQLWVAACLYRFYVDQYEFMYGPLSVSSADAVYADAARLGTTLNVQPDMWPADRAAFEVYWGEQTRELTIDPPVRDMLVSLADLSFLPRPLGRFGTVLHRLFGRQQLFMTKGALPEPFRRAMGFDWTAADDIRYRKAIDRYRRIDRVTPGLLKGYNEVMLAGLRIRRRFGIRVF
ncbi:uncharacterized protein (DUF2236 family) [Williamsia limnetica]|uniref:Uncharacterized protein (DUF2236 family) n=1 Tax=Williamsia limnetica TaxID=882452 RepID=A0A318RYZ2_WILLI|nr:oxygenase MpaB family protein [Williamsia limnetica]PYE19175.1 uncharacterized protein (DUF2236 family) [Williamsia limnetica]